VIKRKDGVFSEVPVNSFLKKIQFAYPVQPFQSMQRLTGTSMPQWMYDCMHELSYYDVTRGGKCVSKATVSTKEI